MENLIAEEVQRLQRHPLYRLPPEKREQEAAAILEERNRWCREMIVASPWVRLRDALAKVDHILGIPIPIWRLGKPASVFYEEHYPDRVYDIQTARWILRAGPLVRRVFGQDLFR